jgi:5-methylthioadenosine/S-adenosylhomocysteine deaminase
MKDAVHQVFVEGQRLVDDGRVISIDRDGVMQEIAARLSEPESAAEREARVMTERLMPFLEQVHRDNPL